MPVMLAGLARLMIIASFLLVGCTRSSPAAQVTLPSPTETGARVSPADPVTPVTSRSTPSLSPTSFPTQEPAATPTSVPTILPTPRVIDSDNLDQLTQLYTLDHSPNKVTAVIFSPDGTKLATSSEDGQVRVWSALDGTLLLTLSGHSEAVNSLAFSPDGEILATASTDLSVRLWRAEDGSLVREIDTGLIGKALKVEYSRDGSLIAIAGNLCYIALRDADTGILRRTLKQPHCLAKTGGQVSYWGLAFSPDDLRLITGDGQPGGSGGSIQVWDYASYTSPQRLRGYDLVVRDLSLSPDGATLAVALCGAPEIWLMNVLDGTLIQQLEGHTFRVNGVRFSSDGHLLASAGRDMTVRLWNPASGELLHTLSDHTAAVNSVVFSPNDSLIASGSDDGSVIVWGLAQP